MFARRCAGYATSLASCIDRICAGFLNLPRDIQKTGARPAQGNGVPPNNTQTAWNSLKSEVVYILGNDFDGSYLLLTTIALAHIGITQGAQIAFSAPVLPTAQGPGYKLTAVLFIKVVGWRSPAEVSQNGNEENPVT